MDSAFKNVNLLELAYTWNLWRPGRTLGDQPNRTPDHSRALTSHKSTGQPQVEFCVLEEMSYVSVDRYMHLNMRTQWHNYMHNAHSCTYALRRNARVSYPRTPYRYLRRGCVTGSLSSGEHRALKLLNASCPIVLLSIPLPS